MFFKLCIKHMFLYVSIFKAGLEECVTMFISKGWIIVAFIFLNMN